MSSDPTHVVRSAHGNAELMLSDIVRLHCNGMIDADITYGKGGFYRSGVVPHPLFCYDIDPQTPGVIEADCEALPVADRCFCSVVYDPPFLTYVRRGRQGNGSMIMACQYSGFWTYNELLTHYRRAMTEIHRVLKSKGVAVVKCQDIVHNHRLQCTHAHVIDMAAALGLRLLDLFVLVADRRLPSPNRRGTQKHARVFHCYFLVFVKA